mmetsp:Transcript_13490/g.16342  ORF Transcript_13490/g.16342 Transcript_13490/m.16342 type:complete len:359 (+) Transcript_13490:185-1261(+)
MAPCGCCRSWSDQAKGLVIAVSAVLILSPDTLLISIPDINEWDLIFYRNLFSIFPIAAFLIYRSSFSGVVEELKKLGWIGVAAALVYSIGSIFFTLATLTVGAANTLVVLAAAPMFCSVVSICLLNEYPRKLTIGAIIVAFCAVAIVVGPGLSSDEWYGNIFALLACFGQALYLNIGRLAELKRNADVIPSLMMAVTISMLASLCFGAQPSRVDPKSADFGFLILQGLIISLSFSLLTLATGYITAPETSLCFLLETCLGPLWVWMVLGEKPSTNTFIGGGILIVNILIHNTFIICQDRKSRETRKPETKSRVRYETDQDIETPESASTSSSNSKADNKDDTYGPIAEEKKGTEIQVS